MNFRGSIILDILTNRWFSGRWFICITLKKKVKKVLKLILHTLITYINRKLWNVMIKK